MKMFTLSVYLTTVGAFAWSSSSQQYGIRSHVLPFNGSFNSPYPDFYILGAPKCATTSLHDLLTKHPDICHSRTKEVHYFDDPAHYHIGPHFWEHIYDPQCSASTGHKKYIDSTPNYLDNKEAIIRMSKSFDEGEIQRKKFIIILREPVA
eukprot:CAMPEP_0174992928 /NCGR_PEP_ID=MMETSP0004_2-20121128/22795_1 /TAXON_ID=420556 /ORGANISM="Ochromonas sp., Strain CCMP1393" /LENGTH=149 /DNA_ID=CAMNT_0016246993 /DNA_START=594 /DNA_END=1040 /DNA_ORIENTATION=-